MKTLKIRVFPTDEEKEVIQDYFDQYRWYYNATLNIVKKNYVRDGEVTKTKFSYYQLRDLLRKYSYVEEGDTKDLIYSEDRNEFPIPYWWKNVGNRVIRGSVKKFTSSINSALSNLKNGNISHFRMSYQSRKGNEEIVHFEDKNFPAFLRDIESKYWYRCEGNKLDKRTRKYITYREINSGKGLEIIHEKDTDRYFYHVPIEDDWFPEDDIRNENQISNSEEGNESSLHRRIISLDPGVRKFLVGYDYTGEVIFIGEGANKKMIKLLLETDEDYHNPKLWRKIKNYVSELHNKVVKFLIDNYDEIILPEFRVSEMVKGKRLSRMTKRLMNMFSFWKFREKLENKCLKEGKRLYIVDESYTSKTCGNCGKLKDLKGEEVYRCEECGIEIDRDVNGARNIFMKNIRLLR